MDGLTKRWRNCVDINLCKHWMLILFCVYCVVFIPRISYTRGPFIPKLASTNFEAIQIIDLFIFSQKNDGVKLLMIMERQQNYTRNFTPISFFVPFIWNVICYLIANNCILFIILPQIRNVKFNVNYLHLNFCSFLIILIIETGFCCPNFATTTDFNCTDRQYCVQVN